MDEIVFCQVRGCKRRIIAPEATFIFCHDHWYDYLTPRKRADLRWAYEKWTAGSITLRKRRMVELDCLKFLERFQTRRD